MLRKLFPILIGVAVLTTLLSGCAPRQTLNRGTLLDRPDSLRAGYRADNRNEASSSGFNIEVGGAGVIGNTAVVMGTVGYNNQQAQNTGSYAQSHNPYQYSPGGYYWQAGGYYGGVGTVPFYASVPWPFQPAYPVVFYGGPQPMLVVINQGGQPFRIRAKRDYERRDIAVLTPGQSVAVAMPGFGPFQLAVEAPTAEGGWWLVDSPTLSVDARNPYVYHTVR